MEANLCTTERIVRGVAGASLVTAGLVVVRGVPRVVVCLLGATLILSASVGFCHVYKVLHISTSGRAQDR